MLRLEVLATAISETVEGCELYRQNSSRALRLFFKPQSCEFGMLSECREWGRAVELFMKGKPKAGGHER